MFLQLEEARKKGVRLEGAGIIVPKIHRYLDGQYQPSGYNLGWNCGEIAGQHIPHAHFHVLPRYEDEPLARKGIRYMFKGEKNKRKTRL